MFSFTLFGMKKQIVLALAAVGAWATRRYYRNWGATKEEDHAPMVGDELIHAPVAQTTAAEWVDAPFEAVWPHLVQLVYRNDSPAVSAQPAIGEVVRRSASIGGRCVAGITLSVVDVIDRRALVLRTVHSPVPIDVTCAWLVEPRWEDRTRVTVRLRVALRHPGDFILAAVAEPVLALLTRRQLGTIRRVRGGRVGGP